MDRIESMRMLLASVDAGSFSAAARQLGVPVQTVSRRILDLEAALGTSLLARTTRKLALTDAGLAYVAAARRIVELMEEAEREAAGEFVAPRGDLVLAAPLFFGRLHIVPIVADFLALFPEINVRLVLGDRNVDLLDDQVDMAVRIGRLPDSGMIATRVGAMRAVVCGSPGLLAAHGAPQAPEDLQGLPCVTSDGPASTAAWRFRQPGSDQPFEMKVKARLTTTAEAAVGAAVRGVGLCRSLIYQVDAVLRSGDLQRVLQAYELDPFPVHLLHAPRSQMPLKMRRFLDFAAPRLRTTLAQLDDER